MFENALDNSEQTEQKTCEETENATQGDATKQVCIVSMIFKLVVNHEHNCQLLAVLSVNCFFWL